MSLTNVCACVDEMPACDYCEEKARREYMSSKPAKPEYSDMFKSDPDDIYVKHKCSDEGRYYDIYSYTDKSGENPYFVKVDQDGGESIHEGEY